MNKTKKIVSLVLAVMMVVTMMSVMAVSVSAADEVFEYTNASGKVTKLSSISHNVLSNGTYKLLKDVTLDSRMSYYQFAKDVTLDLNGYTLTCNDPTCAIALTRGGSATSPKKFTLTDTSGKKGKLVCEKAKNSAIKAEGAYNDITIENVIIEGNSVLVGSDNQTVTINNAVINGGNDFALVTNGASTTNAKITVNNSTLTSDITAAYLPGDADVKFNNTDVTGATAVYVKGGNVEINGGTYTATGTKTPYTYAKGSVTATGDAVVVDNCGYHTEEPTAKITSGEFIATDTASQGVASYVAQDDTTNYTGEAQYDQVVGFVSGGSFNTEVAENLVADGFETVEDPVTGEKTVGCYINTAEELAAAATKDGQYILSDNITLDKHIEIKDNHTLTIDLNGKNIENANGYCFVLRTGTALNLVNTSETESVVSTKKASYYVAQNQGTLNVGENVTVEGQANPAGGIFNYTNGTVNVNGGKVIGHGANVAGIYTVTNNTVNVNAGEVSATGTYAISSNGTAGNEGYTIKVNGGKVTSDTESAIYSPNDGTVWVTGGEVTGATAIYAKSGQVKINGGKLNATKTPGVAYSYYGNGAVSTGDAVVIENCGYPGKAPTASITGGTFVVADTEKNQGVASYVKQDDPDPKYASATCERVVEFVSGGTFNTPVAENLAAPDFVPAERDPNTNMYTVKPYILKDLAVIEGYQNKVKGSKQSTSEEGNDINTKGVRILTKVDKAALEAAGATDYGYVVAKVSGKAQADANFSRLTADGNNGQKVISCKGTHNYGVGAGENYVTLAVNGMNAGDQVAVRFYVVIEGTTYYAHYINVVEYDGMIATME